MITLKQAIKIIDVHPSKSICIVTVAEGWKIIEGKRQWINEISSYYTKETLAKRFDFKEVKVLKIEPNFLCGDYEGWKLYVTYPHKEIRIPEKYLERIAKVKEEAGKYKCKLVKGWVCKNDRFNFIIADSKKELIRELKNTIRK